MSDATGTPHSESAQTTLSVQAGRVHVEGAQGASPATLRWSQEIEVSRNGATVADHQCTVEASDELTVRACQVEAEVRYEVDVASDKLQAQLTVHVQTGVRRTMVDAEASPELTLACHSETLPPVAATPAGAHAALEEAGVVFGIDESAIEAAISNPGAPVAVAQGTPAQDGVDGHLLPLVEFATLKMTGVLEGEALVQVVPKVDGTPGTDVLGAPVRAREARDARVRCPEGAQQQDDIVRATVDGSPRFDEASGEVRVNHELRLEAVDTSTGDINFTGSLAVNGIVQEGRRVIVRHELSVAGNADRAYLESGSHMSVLGTIMSSVLRAGGDRAVAAGIVDMVEEFPRQLAEIAARSGELRNAAASRGQEMSFGLSAQLVTEKMFPRVCQTFEAAAKELDAAGDQHAAAAARFHRWHRTLATAAIANLSAEQFGGLIAEFGAELRAMTDLVSSKANLTVNYVQASEAEATGTVTLSGKGIFNSRIVAWDGVHAENPTAVVRGGSITAHGNVQIHEIGSPGGSTMSVHLGKEATLEADLVHGGTIINSPGGSHRFIADRTDVRVSFREQNLQVDSFAA